MLYLFQTGPIDFAGSATEARWWTMSRSSVVVFAIALTSGGALPIDAADPPEILGRRLSRAEADLERGDYPAAGEVARRILAESAAPDRIRGQALTLLGKVLFFNSRTSLEISRSRGKESAKARARAEEEVRAREEGMRLAEEALRAAVGLDGPHDEDARHYLAQVLAARARAAEAREELAAYFDAIGSADPDPRARHLRECLWDASSRAGAPERSAARERQERADPEAIHQVSMEIDPPRKISGAQPQYTEAAREVRLQGVVIVQVIVGKTGDVRCARPLVGLPLGLTEATLDAFSEWKYEPARLQGEPVAVFYNLTANFRLQ